MAYELWFKVDGQYVPASCQSLQQASLLWDVLNASGGVEMTRNRPLRDAAFNVEARQALHERMDYAVGINSATTGTTSHRELGRFDLMGCIDAPDCFPTGSTESYKVWNGDVVAIATTASRNWLR